MILAGCGVAGHARALRAMIALALVAGAVACADSATAPRPFGAVGLQLAVLGPEAVSEAEVDALAAAFDRVDEYTVEIVDALTLEPIASQSLAITPGGTQHALDVDVPERAFGRTVRITLVAYDDGMELYRSVSVVTLGDGTRTTSIELEIRYTGPGIRGTVNDASGDGAAGVSVNLMDGGTIVAAVGTEPDGTYLFLDVPIGSYEVVPTLPVGAEAICPGVRNVTVRSPTDAIVADFGVRDDTCGTSVLIVSGGDFDDTEDVASLLAGDASLTVSTYFFVNRQPSMELLEQQDIVLLFMNGLFDESAALGTRIADYVAAGGNVVTASFYWQGRSDSGLGSTGWGALESIDPFTSTGGATYQAGTLGMVVPHPLTADLTSLDATGYRGGASAKADTEVVASWNDGTPLVGYRILQGGQRLVGVTLFPGCCATGDTETLWYNAVRWAAAAGGPAPQPSAWIDVAAGAFHTCGLVEDGRAYCWGSNSHGQLGRLDLIGGATPRLASAALRFSEIEAGGNTTCGLTDDGTAYCWGENTLGQVGSGSTKMIVDGPESVSGGPWARLAMGVYHVCALDEASAAHCWGGGGVQDAYRDLALGFIPPDACIHGNSYFSERCSRIPRPVDTVVRFGDIAPGLFATCAVGLDATAYCWGIAQWGQLGIGAYSTVDDARHEPAPVDGATAFRSVSGGVSHMCGVSVADEAYCWGGTLEGDGTVTNGLDAGQVGQGGTPGASPPAPSPSPVVGDLAFSTISAGRENSIHSTFTCGLTPDGAAYCWGRDSEGELGADPSPPVCDGIVFGPAPCTTTPLPVQGGHTFTRLETGLSFACALTPDDRMYCWGANGEGQRGDPTLASTAVPTEVPLPGSGTPSLAARPSTGSPTGNVRWDVIPSM